MQQVETTDSLTETVQAFLDDVAADDLPGSLRQLAREADLSSGLLSEIRNGNKRATPETAEKLRQVGKSWRRRLFEQLVDPLRTALDHHDEP